MVPVQFFQATATVIPTLMIAMFIAAKNGEFLARLTEDAGGFLRVVLGLLALAFIVGVFGAEVASLTAIITGGGGSLRAQLITWVIILLIYMLSFELVDPMVRVIQGLGGWALYSGVLVIFLVTLIYTSGWIQSFGHAHPVP